MIKFAAAAFLVVFLSLPAMAQPSCEKRSILVGHLGEKYNEFLIGVGLSNNGLRIEFLTNRYGRTWTILVTKPDGISCIVSAGENWEIIKPLTPGTRL